MTGKGYIMAINRHGINRTDASPLKKCTFEETVDMLLDAGKDCIYDDLRAVSSNIIVGKLARLGTGMFQLKWDGAQSRKYSTPRKGISKFQKLQHENRKQRRKTLALSPLRENLFEEGDGGDVFGERDVVENPLDPAVSDANEESVLRPLVLTTSDLFGGMEDW